MRNQNSLTTICAALCYSMGVEPPKEADKPNADLVNYIERKLHGKKVDRVFMYNPDAIAQWVYKKYPQLFEQVTEKAELEVPLCSVVPPKTPVCFGTMYTGAQPAVHGITAYEKPVITIDTIFDALIRAGKKPALIAYGQASLGKIYLERNMDYFYVPESGSVDEVNAIAAEVILRDEHDFIVLYNGNYDGGMHKYGPESIEALSEIRANARTFGMIDAMIKKHWKHHDTLVGFAMDHGCHMKQDGNGGTHGQDIDEDMNIVHLYQVYEQEEIK